MRVIVAFFSLFVLCNPVNYAHAARVEMETNMPKKFAKLKLAGNIRRGDARTVMQLLEKAKNQGLVISVLILYSPGGDLVEAMEIGRAIRSRFIRTHAPDVFMGHRYCPEFGRDDELDSNLCNCASACFVVCAAGVERVGDVLGVHRPYFSKEYFEGLSASDAQQKYLTMAKQVREYLKDMDVPQNLVDKMFSTASDEIEYLDEKTVKSMKKVPFFDEWVKASCGENLTDDESYEHTVLLMKKMDGKTLTTAEEYYYNHLNEKSGKFSKCRWERLRKAQGVETKQKGLLDQIDEEDEAKAKKQTED
jgi:hypothetical protein